MAALAREARLSEGLYLARVGAYLPLAETAEGSAFVCADFLERPEPVSFPGASAWRRLAYGVGRLLADERL